LEADFWIRDNWIFGVHWVLAKDWILDCTGNWWIWWPGVSGFGGLCLVGNSYGLSQLGCWITGIWSHWTKLETATEIGLRIYFHLCKKFVA